MDGIILIDKPQDISSFGVVGRVRWALSQKAGKKVKVGHTGTLDPFATGLVILVVGSYCRRAQEFSKLDKTYEATIALGVTSSTGDPEGELTKVSADSPTREAVERALGVFIGEIQQVPPAYSAIKIGGVRAYKLARQGKTVEMPARTVRIYACELLEYAYPHIKVRCRVSSGTYIRTLAADIGEVLGTGAYCAQLRRTSVGEWDIAQATPLDDVTQEAATSLLAQA